MCHARSGDVADFLELHKTIVVATFTPRSRVAISRMLGLRTACYWLSAWQQAGAVHHGTRTAAIVNVRRFVTKSLLFTCKWVG